MDLANVCCKENIKLNKTSTLFTKYSKMSFVELIKEYIACDKLIL